MKILVIEDNTINQQSARQTLTGHDLVVIDNYDEAQEILKKQHEFEAVLVDLLMPASGQCLGDRGSKLQGTEMPVGIFLALLAAKNGAKYVAVFTDTSHHDHPASACFDAFNPKGEDEPHSFTVNEAKVILCNGWGFLDMEHRPLAKNWGQLLRYLTTT